jgi:hypothetical protein
MFLILLAFGGCARRPRGRRGRALHHARHRTPSGPFYPRSVPADTPSILNFAEAGDAPFFVRIGQLELGEGFIGDGGRHAVQLPPLAIGEYAVQQSSDNVKWVTVGVLRVKAPTNWAAVGVGVAVIAALIAVLWWFHEAETRRKRKKRSDEGEQYEPPRPY